MIEPRALPAQPCLRCTWGRLAGEPGADWHAAIRHPNRVRWIVGHSFTNLLFHIVFATKERQPWLTPEMRPKLFDELAGILKGEDALPLIVNGVKDHVHLLVKLKSTHSVAKIVGDLKSRSTGWMHRTYPELAYFCWQTGYGAFTVSQSKMGDVREYIRIQEEHHRRFSVEQEFRGLLKRNGFAVPRTLEWD